MCDTTPTDLAALTLANPPVIPQGISTINAFSREISKEMRLYIKSDPITVRVALRDDKFFYFTSNTLQSKHHVWHDAKIDHLSREVSRMAVSEVYSFLHLDLPEKITFEDIKPGTGDQKDTEVKRRAHLLLESVEHYTETQGGVVREKAFVERKGKVDLVIDVAPQKKTRSVFDWVFGR